MNFHNNTDRLEDKSWENRSDFPLEAFPVQIQEMIKATHATLNFPIDFTGSAILFASSIAIGNTCMIEIKKGWQENGVIYITLVSPSGTNKSHPLSFALKPIIEHDKRTYAIYEKERIEYEKYEKLSQKEKNGTSELNKPVWKKYLVSDFTPEALAEVHKNNQRANAVYVDELAGWFKNFNRYNKGNEMEFWLSNWSRKPLVVDRKSGTPIFINQPFISVCGTIQNQIINELAKDNRTHNGFLDRILFVMPDYIEKQYWSDLDLSPHISESWERILGSLINLPLVVDENNNPQSKLLRLTEDARLLLFSWQKENTNESNTLENEALKGVYSKLEIYAIRLALILEMIQYACNESNGSNIGINAVRGSLKLIEYFKRNALKVHDILSENDPFKKMSLSKVNLYKHLPFNFTTEQAKKIAKLFGVGERTMMYMLGEKELFTKIKQGFYQKVF